MNYILMYVIYLYRQNEKVTELLHNYQLSNPPKPSSAFALGATGAPKGSSPKPAKEGAADVDMSPEPNASSPKPLNPSSAVATDAVEAPKALSPHESSDTVTSVVVLALGGVSTR